jgi:hypothetical protein
VGVVCVAQRSGCRRRFESEDGGRHGAEGVLPGDGDGHFDLVGLGAGGGVLCNENS